MKVMVFVKRNPNLTAGDTEAGRDAAAMDAYTDELVAAGIRLDVAGLRPGSESARVDFSGAQIRVQNGHVAEADEHIVGFWIWRVRSMEEAIEWAKRCPFPSGDVGLLELRPFNAIDDAE